MPNKRESKRQASERRARERAASQDHYIRLRSLNPPAFTVCFNDTLRIHVVTMERGVWKCDALCMANPGDTCRHVGSVLNHTDALICSKFEVARAAWRLIEKVRIAQVEACAQVAAADEVFGAKGMDEAVMIKPGAGKVTTYRGAEI